MLERTATEWAPWHARRGRLEALRAREGDRDGDRGDRGGARARTGGSRRPSAWPSCGGPCGPAAGRGPSRAPSPSPAARACARAAACRPAPASRRARRPAGCERASREIHQPIDEQRDEHAAADDVQRRRGRRRRPRRSRRTRPSAPGSAAPAAGCRRTGCRPAASAAAGASRTRGEVRMARRWRMIGPQGTTTGRVRRSAPSGCRRSAAPQVSSRTGSARPGRTTRRRMPQPWSSASSATGT